MQPPLVPKSSSTPRSSSPPLQPLKQAEKIPLSRKVTSTIFRSGRDIVFGVGDAIWGALTFPDKALKYWFGVDKKLGQNRPWSFSNIGREWDTSLQGNPLYRIPDTAAHLFYGAINTLTAGLPHKIFNEELGLGIEYFAPPPTDLRGSAQWVTQGVLAALPLRGAVGKAIAKRAQNAVVSSREAGVKVSTGPRLETIDRSQGKVYFEDKSNLAPSKTKAKSSPPFGYRMKPQENGAGGGGLQVVEGGEAQITIFPEIAKSKLGKGNLNSGMVYDPPGEMGFRPLEENQPQKFPSAANEAPWKDPGFNPATDIMMVPGLDKKPETIGDPKTSDAGMKDPKSEVEKYSLSEGRKKYQELLLELKELPAGEIPEFLRKIDQVAEEISNGDLQEMMREVFAKSEDPTFYDSISKQSGDRLMKFKQHTPFWNILFPEIDLEMEASDANGFTHEVREGFLDPELLRKLFRFELYRQVGERPETRDARYFSFLLNSFEQWAGELSDRQFPIGDLLGEALLSLLRNDNFKEYDNLLEAMRLLPMTLDSLGIPTSWTEQIYTDFLRKIPLSSVKNLDELMTVMENLADRLSLQDQFLNFAKQLPNLVEPETLPDREDLAAQFFEDWDLLPVAPDSPRVVQVRSLEEKLRVTREELRKAETTEVFPSWSSAPRILVDRGLSPEEILLRAVYEGSDEALEALLGGYRDSAQARSYLEALATSSDLEIRQRTIGKIEEWHQFDPKAAIELLLHAAETTQDAAKTLMDLAEEKDPTIIAIFSQHLIRQSHENPQSPIPLFIVTYAHALCMEGNETALEMLFKLAQAQVADAQKYLLFLAQDLKSPAGFTEVGEEDLKDPVVLRILHQSSLKEIRERKGTPISTDDFGSGGIPMASILAGLTTFDSANQVGALEGISLVLTSLLLFAAIQPSGLKRAIAWLKQKIRFKREEPAQDEKEPAQEETQTLVRAVRPKDLATAPTLTKNPALLIPPQPAEEVRENRPEDDLRSTRTYVTREDNLSSTLVGLAPEIALGLRVIQTLLLDNPAMPLASERRKMLQDFVIAFGNNNATPFPPWLFDITYKGKISGGFTAFLLPNFPQHREVSSAIPMKAVKIDAKEGRVTLQTLPDIDPPKALLFRSEVGPLPFFEGETVLLLPGSGGGIGSREGFRPWLSGLEFWDAAATHPYRDGPSSNSGFSIGKLLNRLEDFPKNVHQTVRAMGRLARHPEFLDFTRMGNEILLSSADP